MGFGRVYFFRHEAAIDELPCVSVTRLRAMGDVTPAMKTTTVSVARSSSPWPWRCTVGRMAAAGRFLCAPAVGAREPYGCSRVGLRCRRCCKARGLRYRIELIRTENRAAYHAPRSLARLNSDKPARLHPRPGRKLDRRANLEFALRRSLIVAREHELEGHDLRDRRLKGE